MLRLIGRRCVTSHTAHAQPTIYRLNRNKECSSARFASTAPTTETILPTALINLWQSISTSSPVLHLQDGLIQVHDLSGLPWWCSIIISTVCLRLVITLPLTIYQQKISARLELLALEMPAIAEELKREAARAKQKFKWTEQQTKRMYMHSLKKQWNNLIVRDNCHPFKLFIVLWGQIPLWICQSMALRNIVYMLPDPFSVQAQIAYRELTVGGFAWIPNLTEVDSSYLLPIALGLINLSIIEVQSALRAHLPQSRLQKYGTHAFRVLSLFMVPIACTVPSALCVYWTASSAYGLAQNLLLTAPKVRRAIGIPHTKRELDNPYLFLSQTFKSRIGLGPPPIIKVTTVEAVKDTAKILEKTKLENKLK